MTSSQRTQAFQFMAVEKKVTDFFTDTGKFGSYKSKCLTQTPQVLWERLPGRGIVGSQGENFKKTAAVMA